MSWEYIKLLHTYKIKHNSCNYTVQCLNAPVKSNVAYSLQDYYIRLFTDIQSSFKNYKSL
jgi:hypothetical protein